MICPTCGLQEFETCCECALKTAEAKARLAAHAVERSLREKERLEKELRELETRIAAKTSE